jgi:hypothetical protein
LNRIHMPLTIIRNKVTVPVTKSQSILFPQPSC